MYNILMTYWAIGIIFVTVYHLTTFIYVKSQGNSYIYNEEKVSFIIIILMNIILSILYPLFIILLILDSQSSIQTRRQMTKKLIELKNFIDTAKEKENKETTTND